LVEDREKVETFRERPELAATGANVRRASIVNDAVPKNATETAWTVYRARHPEVDASDSRRCLLERHLLRRWEERESDTEELAGFGIAYLYRLPRDEC